jgi:D-alanyl-D-alanine dipeptidase
MRALLSVSRSIFHLLPLLAVSAAMADSPSDFVEPSKLDPTIRIELPYATEKNFCKIKLYPVERCFLRREVAEKLVEAHRSLAKEGIGIKIWDGYRPHSVQYTMWDASPSPGYVGHPRQGSKHNRGAAVDVTLVDLETGKELEMPTPYDEFSPRAHSSYFKLSEKVAANRKRLQTAMREAGGGIQHHPE